MRNLHNLLAAAAVTMTVAANAADTTAPSAADSTAFVPERVIVVSGNPDNVNRGVVAVLYDSNDFAFHDPSAPRFLFLDRKGKIALGIGGYVYGTASYDFAGVSQTGSDFVPSAIPAPADPAKRGSLQFTAAHSTVFLQLAGHSEKFGTYSAYIQTNFTGSDSYELKLKQAYFRVGYVTLGLARSVFADAAGIATVDTQGPNGLIDAKNILVSYTPQVSRHFRLGISVEQPKATYTLSSTTASIAQRVPDIPAFVEYDWGKSNHIRLSGLLRNLSYRDLASGKNRIATGYGVQISGISDLGGGVSLYVDGSFGRGIGAYINDLAGRDYDLIPDPDKPGRLRAPRTFAYAAGLNYNFCANGFATVAWGQARLYDQGAMAADTYRRGSYLSVNAFYTIFSDCLLGLEYARGWRYNIDGSHGTANRIMAALRYSF